MGAAFIDALHSVSVGLVDQGCNDMVVCGDVPLCGDLKTGPAGKGLARSFFNQQDLTKTIAESVKQALRVLNTFRPAGACEEENKTEDQYEIFTHKRPPGAQHHALTIQYNNN
jgi:hypothetical protein